MPDGLETGTATDVDVVTNASTSGTDPSHGPLTTATSAPCT